MARDARGPCISFPWPALTWEAYQRVFGPGCCMSLEEGPGLAR